MDKYLLNQKGLKYNSSNRSGCNDKIRKFFANPIGQYVIFGIVMLIVGYLAGNNILPYSWSSGLGSTFAFSIASIGFCLLMGYSGLASLGTGGFIGLGTYSMYYVMGEWEAPFILALLVAVAISVLVGLAVGFISLRIEGIYLAILTLGLSEILRNLYMVVQDTIKLSSIQLFGITIPRTSSIYVVTVFLVIVMIITGNLINSPTGRAMLAMKNSTAAAQAMGISLLKYRLLAFVICTLYASIAGLMLMVVVRSSMASDSNSFYALITSLNILAAVIIGGYRSIWGAIFGSFVMYGMQTMFLYKIPFLQENPVIITFIAGVLVILVVMFYPGGIAQLASGLKSKISKLIKKSKESKYGKDVG